MEQTKPRMCYWICANQSFNPELKTQGYIPSLVKENEAGHSPMLGQGAFATPWYWGMTYSQACRTAAKANMEKFGLSEQEAALIVASSIGAQNSGRNFAEDKL